MKPTNDGKGHPAIWKSMQERASWAFGKALPEMLRIYVSDERIRKLIESRFYEACATYVQYDTCNMLLERTRELVLLMEALECDELPRAYTLLADVREELFGKDNLPEPPNAIRGSSLAGPSEEVKTFHNAKEVNDFYQRELVVPTMTNKFPETAQTEDQKDLTLTIRDDSKVTGYDVRRITPIFLEIERQVRRLNEEENRVAVKVKLGKTEQKLTGNCDGITVIVKGNKVRLEVEPVEQESLIQVMSVCTSPEHCNEMNHPNCYR